MIRIKINNQAALNAMSLAEEQQFPFAISRALNRVANDAQEAERDEIKAHFKIRRESWNMRGIKILKRDRATKTDWSVIVQVAPEANYLDKFEEQGIHAPAGGRQYLWIPNPKIWRNGIVSDADPLRPNKIKFTRDPHGRMEGNMGTYMIKRHSDGGLMVMRNTGLTGHKGFTLGSMKAVNLDNLVTGIGPRQRHERQLVKRKVHYKEQARVKLYTLKSQVKVPIKLQFVDTVTKTVNARYWSRFRESMDDALRNAR